MMLDNRNAPPLFDVGAAWQILWRRRRLVLGITLAVIVGAGLYVALTKPSYTAATAILVDPRDVKTTNIDSVLPGIGADSAAIASQVSVIESRDLLGKVYDTLGLATDPDYAAGGGMLSFLRGSATPSPEAAFQKFLGTVGVEREGLTYVIDVTVKSGDPAKAARIANAIVEQYIGATSAQQNTASSDVTTALNGKITALQNDAAAAERAVADFKQQNGIFDETTGGTLQSQVDQLTAQLIAARDTLAQAQTKVDQASAAGTSAQGLARLAEISSSTTADKLRDDYNDKAAALAVAQATYGPKHPTVIQAQAQVNKVEGLLAREAGRIAKQLKSDRDAARTNLDKLEASLDALRQQANQSSLATVGLRQLQGKADAARAVLNDFMQRSQETSQLQGLQNSQVHVISAAAPPPEPTWPKPLLLLPVSAVLGLLLGCGTALLVGQNAFGFRPVPAPAPATPDKPRRRSAKDDAPAPQQAPASMAQRWASLDVARREIFAGDDTPLTTAVQALLHDVVTSLPSHAKPYVVRFRSLRDPALAARGMALAAIGFERIGGKPLVLEDQDAVADAGQYTVLLVGARHHLASTADVDVLVLTPDEQRKRPREATGIVFVLREPAGTWPRLVTTSTDSPALVAG